MQMDSVPSEYLTLQTYWHLILVMNKIMLMRKFAPPMNVPCNLNIFYFLRQRNLMYNFLLFIQKELVVMVKMI